MSPQKVVICGAGFLGSIPASFQSIHDSSLLSPLPSGRHIGKALASTITTTNVVQLCSRNPQKVWEALHLDPSVPNERLLPPIPVDITDPNSLRTAFKDAALVISLVGIMHGSPQDFYDIQCKGVENVAMEARNVGAELVHFSAIGASPSSDIPYVRTKGLGERSVRDIVPRATIVRPSLVFGPEDDFFNRFARLSRFLPFLPVFGGGESRFQPVYVGDLARLVEIIARCDTDIQDIVAGKVVVAGGPQVFTYRRLMELILTITGRRRPIISLPFAVGMIQGRILEMLPVNLFTVTQAQIKQLKSDNIVNPKLENDQVTLEAILKRIDDLPLRSVQEILPTYLN